MAEKEVELDAGERLLVGYSGKIFVAVSVITLGLQIGRAAIPPLLPSITAGLAISPSQAGLALTISAVFSALFQYIGGSISDQLSRKSVIICSVAVAILGFGLLTMSGFYLLFLVGIGFLGISMGLYFVATRAALADVFVERRGRAYGVLEAITNSGTLIAAGFAVVVLQLGPWQFVFLPAIGLLLVSALLYHSWSREPYVVTRPTFEVRDTVDRVLGEPHIRLLLIAYSLQMFARTSVIQFLPTMLQADKSLSPELAAGVYAVVPAIAMVVLPFAGSVSDRGSRVLLSAGILVVATVGLTGLLVVPSAPVAIGGSLVIPSVPMAIATVIVFAAGISAFPPVMQSYLMHGFDDANMAEDFGAFKTVYAIVGSLGPVYVGFVAEQINYVAAFAGSTICLVVSAGILYWCAR